MLDFLFSVLRLSTPLIFAAMGGFLSERAGVVNIALEGLMLVGAFAAAAATVYTGSLFFGIVAAGLAGVVFAAIYGLFVLQFRVDTIVGGTAINLLAAGTVPFFCKIFFGVTGSTPSLAVGMNLDFWMIVGAWGVVAVLQYGSSFTPMGLWHQFAGEKPAALESAGISVRKIQWISVLASGAMAAMGGMTLSILLSSGYSRNMTAGRGFMALAALIFGKWRPLPAALACLLFAAAEAAQIRLPNVLGDFASLIPAQAIQVLPYVVTLFFVVGWVGRSRAPSALKSHPWSSG